MKIIEAALFTFLQTNPTIAAFVGGAGATPPSTPRIYPVALRQDSLQLPAISYSTIAGESELAISGRQSRLGYRRIQISVWSVQRFESETIVEALRALLSGYIGLWGDVNVSVVSFAHAPVIFDNISKLSHVPCQIAVYHDEP